MKFLFGLTILAWGTHSVASADVKTFTFRLSSYPATVQTCHTVALDLAKTFAKATGLPVVDGRCMTQGTSGFDMEIRYQAEKPVEPVSTEYLKMSVYERGRYADEAACKAALPAKQAEFEKYTELPTAFAYCFKALYGNKYPWLVRLDGFGTPKLAPYFGGYSMFAIPKGLTAPEFKQGLADAIAAQGGALSDATIHSQLGMADVGIHYYADKHLKFDANEYTKTETLDQCLSQVSELRTAFQTVKYIPGLVYCGYISVGADYESTVVTVGDVPLKSRQSVETFPSFADCEKGRPALVKLYETQLKADIRGSACTRSSRNLFRVVLLEP